MVTTTTSSTSSSPLPDYVETPVKESLTGINDWLKSDANYVYGSKPGEQRYAGWSDLQKDAVGNAEWLADQDIGEMLGHDQANDWLKQYATSGDDLIGMGDVATGRIVDEDGSLGAVQDYMNPWLDQVLDAQMRALNERTALRENDAGASAAMSGSFGDARHALTESLINQDANRAATDAAAQTYSAGYDRAMGLRAEDLNRMYGGREAALERKAAGAGAMMQQGDRYLQQFSDINDMLFNAGQAEQDERQTQLDEIRSFQEAVSKFGLNNALTMLGAATGAPMPTSTTQTNYSTEESNDGFWGGLGSIIGGLFG